MMKKEVLLSGSLFCLDVTALYPNIVPDFVPVAVRHALVTTPDFPEERIDAIVALVVFSIQNAVTHYRGDWFKSILGLPTLSLIHI